MQKRTLLIILGITGSVVVLILFLLFIGVGYYRNGVTDTGYSSGYDSIEDYSSTPPNYLLSLDDSAKLEPEQLINDAEGSKVQKNGSVSILVENIDESVTGLKSINGKYSGQITNIYDYGQGNDRVVQITVKVPVEDFEKYYNELRELDGEVTYANVSTTDVTEEYIDITSRLTNLRNTEAQLNKILERAESVGDVLAVQRELNTVRGEIESYEQRKRYFDSQTDYSFMSVTFALDKTGLNIAEDQWKPWGEFKVALKSLISVLKGFVDMVIWIVVFSPIILIPFFTIRYFVKRNRAKKST